jgi:hypothetical protein
MADSTNGPAAGSGYLTSEYALMAQNIAITLINLFGIYRWLIWKVKI